jgi:hypothetical protein
LTVSRSPSMAGFSKTASGALALVPNAFPMVAVLLLYQGTMEWWIVVDRQQRGEDYGRCHPGLLLRKPSIDIYPSPSWAPSWGSAESSSHTNHHEIAFERCNNITTVLAFERVASCVLPLVVVLTPCQRLPCKEETIEPLCSRLLLTKDSLSLSLLPAPSSFCFDCQLLSCRTHAHTATSKCNAASRSLPFC